MHCAHSCGPIANARRVNPRDVAKEGEHPRFVEHHPVLYAVTKRLDARLSVGREVTDNFAIRPASFVLERLGQVPVVQRRERPDAVREQLVDQTVVVIEARLVQLPFAFGKDAGPGDAEAVAP